MGFDSPLDSSEAEGDDGVAVVPLSSLSPLSPLSPLSIPLTWKNNMRVQSKESVTNIQLQSCIQIYQ